jgi:hypothetical protein
VLHRHGRWQRRWRGLLALGAAAFALFAGALALLFGALDRRIRSAIS